MNIDFYKPLGIALSRKKAHEQYLFKNSVVLRFCSILILGLSDIFHRISMWHRYFACQITSNEERLYLR